MPAASRRPSAGAVRACAGRGLAGSGLARAVIDPIRHQRTIRAVRIWVLVVAGCFCLALAAGCSSNRDASETSRTSTTTIPGDLRQRLTSSSFISGCARASILHRGEMKVFLSATGRCARVFVCESHGATAISSAPRPSPTEAAKRLVWKRAKKGKASLSISTSPSGSVNASCR